MNALNIEIFSDLICPWCYIGRRRLEAGLKILGANELPNIIWRPFELNPDMPKAGLDRKAYRSAKFGSWERSQAMDREVAEIGRTLGLEFNYDRVLITPNTRAVIVCFGGRETKACKTLWRTPSSEPTSRKGATSGKMKC